VACLAIGMALSVAGFRSALAAAAEFEVYTDEIEQAGGFDLELLSSMALSGTRGGAVEDEGPEAHTLQLAPELEYGLGAGLEADFYALLSRAPSGWSGNGAELQLRYVHQPRRPTTWFWGVVGEVARLSEGISGRRTVLEVRPVAGWRSGRWLIALNPAFEITLAGGDSRAVEAEAAAKLSWAITANVRVGLEHFARLGVVGDTEPRREQSHLLFGVVDAQVGGVGVNVGVGRGLTNASPAWVAKAILRLDLD